MTFNIGASQLVYHLAFVQAAAHTASGAGVTIEIPLCDSHAVGMDGCTIEIGRQAPVVLGDDVTTDDAPRLAHVDFVRAVAIVGEFIGGNASSLCRKYNMPSVACQCSSMTRCRVAQSPSM